MREKKAKITWPILALTAITSMGLGFLKIYTYYHSIFRFGLLDYIISTGRYRWWSYGLYSKKFDSNYFDKYLFSYLRDK